MNNERIAEFLQEPLQEAFDTECRSYEIYLKVYESMLETWEKLEMQLDELKEKQELDEKISSYNQAFNSSEFDKIKKLVNLSDSVAKSFISAFSVYEGMSGGLTEKMAAVEYMQKTISRCYSIFRKRLKDITSVSTILGCASDADVKLTFCEKNPIAERLLIIYYSDMNNFKYYRNIIEIKGCKLEKDFMRAYLAEGESEEEEAIAWFCEKAKKYKV